MKEVSKHGMPKKDGWYWMVIPYFNKTEAILCRVVVDKDYGGCTIYEWNDIKGDRPLSGKVTQYKPIPKPKITT